jgi:hypothetical protein
MTDRLAEIEYGDGLGPSERAEDILWLIAAVKRLRLAMIQILDDDEARILDSHRDDAAEALAESR